MKRRSFFQRVASLVMSMFLPAHCKSTGMSPYLCTSHRVNRPKYPKFVLESFSTGGSGNSGHVVMYCTGRLVWTDCDDTLIDLKDS